MRKIAKDTGAVHPKLTKLRKQSADNLREQRASATLHGYKTEQRRCKGPDGLEGDTCTNLRATVLLFSAARAFPSAPRVMPRPIPRPTRKLLLLAVRKLLLLAIAASRRLLALFVARDKAPTARTANFEHTTSNDSIKMALQRTGMVASAICAAMQKDALKAVVEAFVKSKRCLPCFKRTHRSHAETLKKFTLCDAKDGAGVSVSCPRIAYQKGLCRVHLAPTLPASRTRCRESACKSGELRAPRKGGYCNPCFDAIVARNADVCPPAQLSKKRRKL
jgi:hypothetical protein